MPAAKTIPGYRAAHSRLVRLMGRASDHQCWACDEPAAGWAYDHQDADEIDSEHGVYSLDPAHYVAACRRCHWQMDRAVDWVLTVPS